MCNFCKEDCKKVAYSGVKMGYQRSVLNMQVWLMKKSEYRDTTHLEFSLNISGGCNVKTLNLPIKYCPVCGREL